MTAAQPVALKRDAAGAQENQQEQRKLCKECGRELPVSEFGRHSRSKDGLMCVCNDCRRRMRTKGTSKGNPLEKFTARELMHELALRGYEGNITFTEVKVHKMKLNEM